MIDYFLKYVAYDFKKAAAAFTFSRSETINSTENVVLPDLWAFNSSSGILNSNVNFFQNIGTGFFNGSTIMTLNNPYAFENDTIILSYEKLRHGDEILLSSAEGNSFSTYAGFCLGVNNANKLYFKYWNPVEGPFTFMYPDILSNKNSILLNRNFNTLTMGVLNNNTSEFELRAFDIKNSVFLQGSGLSVGGMYDNLPWANDGSSNFSGYIDKFYILKDFQLFYKELLVSGLVYSEVQNYGENRNVCFTTGFLRPSGFSSNGITGYLTEAQDVFTTGITGYQNILTGFHSYTGVTGYRNVSQGFFSYCSRTIEIFGVEPISGLISTSGQFLQELTGLIKTTIYNQIPLTGNVTGITQIYVTGEVCRTIFFPTGEPVFLKNNNYLKSLSFSAVSLLSTLNRKKDIIEVYHEDYIDKILYYNRDLIFDSTRKVLINNENISDNILLFLNGQAIIDSGFYRQVTDYDSNVIPNNDYYQSGSIIFIDSGINGDNQIFYDYITGESKIRVITGQGGPWLDFVEYVGPEYFSNYFQLLDENFTNKFVFINGQKLISGVTYTGINTITLNVSTGDNFVLLKSVPNFNYYTGNLSTTTLTKQNLNKNSSQLYLNGIKQKIGQNYLEISSFDLLSGNFIENQNNYLIYNNTDDFFV